MTFLKYFSLLIILPVVLFTACKEYNSLDSIEITPLVAHGSDNAASSLYVCDSSGDQFRQFQVIGTYDDDDTEDLSSEVTWTADSTGDEYLSENVPGLVSCTSNIGLFGIKATYTFENEVSGEGEETNSSELTDTIIMQGIN